MSQTDRIKPEETRPEELRLLAGRALRQMILEGRLSAGDLIKVLAMMEEAPDIRQGADYVIRLVED